MILKKNNNTNTLEENLNQSSIIGYVRFIQKLVTIQIFF